MTTIDLIRWLGETSLAVSILTILVLIIRKPVASAFGARAAYALWLAPAARLFLPELKLLPAPQTAPAELAVDPAYVIQASNVMLAETAPGFDWPALAAAIALILWATIAVAWFSLKLEAQTRYMRARRENSEAPSAAIAEMAQAIARQLGLRHAPIVRISKDNEAGPCVIGLFRPVIFLPEGFERNYSGAEQRLALAHEIAHVARGDMAATLAAIALQAVQWPNPLAHLSFRAFRTDQEAACDAYMLARCAKGGKAAGDYAAAILKSVRTEMKTPAYGLALAHPVKERLMLLKSPKKSRLRLLAGAAAVAAFTAASLAATASYGFADETAEKKENRIVKKRSVSRTVIEADKGETLKIDGVKDARKIDIKDENEERTIRIYGEGGKLISEDVYGPGEETPFETIKFIGKDGVEKEISFDRTGDEHDYIFIGDGDAPLPPSPPGIEKRVMVIRADAESGAIHPMLHMTECAESDGNVAQFEWKDEDGDDADKTITHEVICLDGESADPEKRAEALRKAITMMEADAKKDAARRKEHIAKMKEALKKAEKEAKKK